MSIVDVAVLPVKKNRDTLHGNNNRLAIGSCGVCVDWQTRTPSLLPCGGKTKKVASQFKQTASLINSTQILFGLFRTYSF